MMFVLGILIFFVGILFSVFWHELGHFVTARWFGIKVPEFMVGFGRTIWSTKRGETEYGLKAIPLGGYIRMIGMIPPARGELLGSSRRTGPFQGLIDDVRRQSAMDVRPEDAHRQFYLRKPWKRIVVMAAGPVMNLILAVLLFAVLLMGIGMNTGTTTVSAVSECVLPADSTTTSCPVGAPPTPAAVAGFRAGDEILALDGQQFSRFDGEELRAAIQQSTGPVVVTVLRDGQRLDLTPTPIRNLVASVDDPTQIVEGNFLGIGLLQDYERQSLGAVFVEIGDVVGRTGQAIAELPSRVPGLFGSVFLGEERDVNGPIGIVGVSRIGGEVLEQEIPFVAEASLLLSLLAAVNISLFLFNLLPIPPLDGGQIFPAIWEAVKKRIWRLRGRPDPGPVDVAKLMPVAYVVAMVFIVWSGLLLVADVINPVRLFQ
ncbi:site-2 protease family protein [Pseudonocardia sp. KRD-184]|uniref:Site-2 protease family protein n=1 Tax=Pseudonocardia oceani TaxID=2792013 RepID=A0ABS6UDX6_9PSEU|nr:site-2 protease family protein [Pseudonocardia oceani]MBW0088180.1 site-2 protease family protein [Pseudonocardia oceani]MBW0094819.1 site-2 protease family protein [Pseudonocardia oceani]MBW0107597.1 site-2 protease family protein [Pseudonocardia oceani]MBW0121020.1 site-2 protease family protein [Pseudonocardia oceani]MBW0130441.1 site-2 protease family protein [Pseudonocardia oceani]